MSLKQFLDATYVLYVQEFQGPGEPLMVARDRAHDSFLSPEELRRKQNAESFRKLGIRP